MTTEEVKRVMIAGFGRFLAEMPPVWSADGIIKMMRSLKPSLTAESAEYEQIMRELQQDNVVYYVGKPDVYLLLTEDFIKENSVGVYQKFALKKLAELKALHHPLPHQP
jgi:hypothetical protein